MKFKISDEDLEKAMDNFVPLYKANECIYHPSTDNDVEEMVNNMLFIPDNILPREERCYCVYFHFTKDTHKLFYVGIGDKYRPKSKKGRNDFWHKEVNKHGYTIEIAHQNLTWHDCCHLEMFYVAKYGRRDLDENGILVNRTKGGDGTRGVIKDESTKKIVSSKLKTHYSTDEGKEKQAEKMNSHWQKPGSREAQSNLQKKRYENPEEIKKSSERMTKFYNNPINRQEVSNRQKNMSIEDKIKKSVKVSEANKKRYENKEARIVSSKAQKKRYEKPYEVENSRNRCQSFWNSMTTEERSEHIQKSVSVRMKNKKERSIITKSDIKQMKWNALSNEEKAKRLEKGRKISETKRRVALEKAILKDDKAK